MSVSVCIATFNGEKYILEQLESIMSQLSENDEVIIVDDCSTDNTVSVLRQYNDYRIKLFLNDENKGSVYTFGKAIQLATKDYIFLADQDDVWTPGRLDIMLTYLSNSGMTLITSGYKFFTSEKRYQSLHAPTKKNHDSKRHFYNILTIFKGNSGYVGCCMAFPKQFKRILLPFPSYIESHDLWIALASNLLRSNIHIDETTLMRRLHCKNVSMVKRNLISKLFSRWIFLVSIFVLLFRICCAKKGAIKRIVSTIFRDKDSC